MQLESLFSDVWKLCNKEWSDDRGSLFLQQYLNIRSLQITGYNIVYVIADMEPDMFQST